MDNDPFLQLGSGGASIKQADLNKSTISVAIFHLSKGKISVQVGVKTSCGERKYLLTFDLIYFFI